MILPSAPKRVSLTLSFEVLLTLYILCDEINFFHLSPPKPTHTHIKNMEIKKSDLMPTYKVPN